MRNDSKILPVINVKSYPSYIYIMMVAAFFVVVGCDKPERVDIGDLVEALNGLDKDEVADADEIADEILVDEDLSAEDSEVEGDKDVPDLSDVEGPDSTDVSDSADVEILPDTDAVEQEPDADAVEAEVEDDLLSDSELPDGDDLLGDDETPDADADTAFCGDSIREGDEQCDEGINNGAFGSYCSDLCVNLGEQQYPVIADTGRDGDFTVTTPVTSQPIVTDAATGLIWQQNHIENMAYYKTPTTAFTYCESLTYAGYDDWHLPTPHELESIIKSNEENPALYNAFLPDSTPFIFWAALPYVDDTEQTWSIDYNNGDVSATAGLADVRCVRRPAAGKYLATRFSEETGSDSFVVVYDEMTGLYWTQNLASMVTRGTEYAYCQELNYGDYDDWRLPGLNELKSLIDYSRSNPATGLSGTAGATIFTNGLYGHSGIPFYVNFADGQILGLGGMPHSNVLCVR